MEKEIEIVNEQAQKIYDAMTAKPEPVYPDPWEENEGETFEDAAAKVAETADRIRKLKSDSKKENPGERPLRFNTGRRHKS
ncbi:MAG: hypothetical protein ACOCW7_01160 [Bacteroidota bacterium]